jgi:hypothetical protein
MTFGTHTVYLAGHEKVAMPHIKQLHRNLLNKHRHYIPLLPYYVLWRFDNKNIRKNILLDKSPLFTAGRVATDVV